MELDTLVHDLIANIKAESKENIAAALVLLEKEVGGLKCDLKDTLHQAKTNTHHKDIQAHVKNVEESRKLADMRKQIGD